MTREFAFTATLWEHTGAAAWHFVTVPDDVSDAVAELTLGRSAGFGSVRVKVTVGGTTWSTSLFPDRTAYVLPVKKAVRTAEGLAPGQPVVVRLVVV